jgi:hypothetical protein
VRVLGQAGRQNAAGGAATDDNGVVAQAISFALWSSSWPQRMLGARAVVTATIPGYAAEVYQLNVAPHNYYSHLASFTSASLCAVLPNVRIMEIDIDDVPWKDELTTAVPEIKEGYMAVPKGPGWGADINADVARAHPWDAAQVSYSKSTPPSKSF